MRYGYGRAKNMASRQATRRGKRSIVIMKEEVSYFTNLRSSKPRKERVFILDLFKHLAETKTHDAPTNTGINYVAGGDNPTEIRRKKESSACITPHAIFKDGRAKDKMRALSGILFFDIDMLDGVRARPTYQRHDMNGKLWGYIEQSQKCEKLLGHIIFAQESISKNGLHLFLRYDESIHELLSQDKTMKSFADYYCYYLAGLANALSEWKHNYKIDAACKDVSRLCILSYGSVYHFNENAAPVCLVLPKKRTPVQAKRVVKKSTSSYSTSYSTDRGALIRQILGMDDLADIIIALGGKNERIGAGREVKVLCPFHNDTTPSLSVNTEEDKWFCHSCQFGGGLVEFIRKLHNISDDRDLNELLKVALKEKDQLYK